MGAAGIRGWGVAGALCVALLAFGCGGGGTGGGGGAIGDPVTGSGVKGPMANATVTARRFDPSASGFKGAVAGTGTTNAAAVLTGLTITPPPDDFYILEYTSTPGTTTDLSTGQFPVLTTLRTIVTAAQIAAGTPVYATPQSTMAVDLAVARADSNVAPFGGNADGTVTSQEFMNALAVASQRVLSTVGFGLGAGIDLFTTPPLLTAATNTAGTQATTAAYRTAVEALTAIAVAMASAPGVSPDDLLAELTADLADGTIDGNVNGAPSTIITATNLPLFSQNPGPLTIPNAPTRTVDDVEGLLIDETGATGVSVGTTGLTSGTVVPQAAQTGSDVDGDGTVDTADDCPLDTDNDADGDGICNGPAFSGAATGANDNCPNDANAGQTDTNSDGEGDVCDNDDDGDLVGDAVDNCPLTVNTDQTDTDGDGAGNACDPDDDNDTVADAADNCPLVANTDQADADSDGAGDVCDACPNDPDNLCGGDGSADALVAQARAALEAQDVETASTLFTLALAADPENRDANLGVAATAWVQLLSDPDVIAIVERWNAVVPAVNEILYSGGGGGAAPKPSALGKATADAAPATGLGAVLDRITGLPGAQLLARLPGALPGLSAPAPLAKTIPDNAPSVSEMQQVIDQVVLPALDAMITAIGKTEGVDFTFALTGAMTGDPFAPTAVLDDGDFLAFDAALHALRALALGLTAYNLDVDYDQIEADPLSALNDSVWGAALSVDPSLFLTLKTDGLTRLASARADLQAAVAKVRAGILFIRDDDPDPDTDNGLSFGPNSLDWVEDPGAPANGTCTNDVNASHDVTQALRLLDAVDLLLAGPVTYSEVTSGLIGVQTTGATVTSVYCEFVDEDFTFDLDVSHLFTTPLDRTDLPGLGYDVTPDETLSGTYHQPVFGVTVGTFFITIHDSRIATTTPLPDDTLNGVLPDGLEALGVPPLVPVTGGIGVVGGPTAPFPVTAVASDGTNLWVADWSALAIHELAADGSVIASIPFPNDTTGPMLPYGMAWHQGELWVTPSGSLVRVNPADGAVLQTIQLAVATDYIADLASDGATLYAWVVRSDQFPLAMSVVPVNTGAATLDPRTVTPVFATTGFWASGLAYDGAGNLFAAYQGDDFTGHTVQVNIVTGNVLTELGGEYDTYAFLNGVLWAADFGSDRLLGFSP